MNPLRCGRLSSTSNRLQPRTSSNSRRPTHPGGVQSREKTPAFHRMGHPHASTKGTGHLYKGEATNSSCTSSFQCPPPPNSNSWPHHSHIPIEASGPGAPADAVTHRPALVTAHRRAWEDRGCQAPMASDTKRPKRSINLHATTPSKKLAKTFRSSRTHGAGIRRLSGPGWRRSRSIPHGRLGLIDLGERLTHVDSVERHWLMTPALVMILIVEAARLMAKRTCNLGDEVGNRSGS